jgi:hypothetical protein
VRNFKCWDPCPQGTLLKRFPALCGCFVNSLTMLSAGGRSVGFPAIVAIGRAILADALPASAMAAPALAPVKDAADRLASAMAARHGGRWVAHVDYESGFALVQPRQTRCAKGGAA